MPNRQRSGDETWSRLKDWTRGQKSSERLAGHIIRADGFQSIDPSHPLGGKDDLKDIVCHKDGKNWICGCYFSRHKQSFNQISKKFNKDYEGIIKHRVDGFVFVTNQELTITQRDELTSQNSFVEIYHLERIVSLLNSPICYGIRLEYLDISLTTEDQIAYFAERDKSVENFTSLLTELIASINSIRDNQSSIPVAELQDFKFLLNGIVGNTSVLSLIGGSPIDNLSVPVNELREFRSILEKIVGFEYDPYSTINKLHVPLSELKEFEEILIRIVGKVNEGITFSPVYPNDSPIDKLHIPLNQLLEYEETIDRIIDKQTKLNNKQK